MIYQGRIEDGVVVFDKAVSLANGTEVLVEVAPPASRLPNSEEFWRDRSLSELIAEQKISPIRRLEDVLGAGKTFWADDAAFDDFVQNIYTRRHDGTSS